MAYTTTRKYENKEDKKQKLMLALIPILAIILVFLLVTSARKSSPAKAQGASTASPAEKMSEISTIHWTAPALYDANFPDPMRLEKPSIALSTEEPSDDATGTTTSSSNLNILGIIYAEGHPTVLIDTDIHAEGDVIAGIKIIKIFEDKVILGKNGERWEQRINIEP